MSENRIRDALDEIVRTSMIGLEIMHLLKNRLVYHAEQIAALDRRVAELEARVEALEK